MERGEIDLLSREKLIVGVVTHIIYEVDDEGVTEGMLGEENDLGAALGEVADDCFAHAAGAALQASSAACLADPFDLPYRHQNNLAVHIPLAAIAAALEVAL